MKRAFKMFKKASKLSPVKISMWKSSVTDLTISEINAISDYLTKMSFGIL